MIEEIKKDSEIKYVNAIIKDDKIIPGKNGLSINESKSFANMKSFGNFNKYYLVYDQKKPKISLEDNKDKIITSGNLSANNVSIIIEYSDKLISFLEKSRIKGNVLINKNNYYNIKYLELINNDFNNYNEVELILNRAKVNKQLCYINDDTSFCKKRNKYLIKTDLVLENDNIIEIKNQIKNGSIIYITKDTSIENIKIILNQISFKGLKIIYLSNLISEDNNN